MYVENLNLNLLQLYVFNILFNNDFAGVDRSGECSMTHHSFIIDDNPPLFGRMKTGPYFDMVS